MKVVAGMDVGKTHVAGPVRRFENTPAGLAALVGWLEREVVCEATNAIAQRGTPWVEHPAPPSDKKA